MYFGRQVVRRSVSTLRPVSGSRVRASTRTPWQIAPTGRFSRQNRPTCSLSTGEPRYCRMPGACPPGRISASKPAGEYLDDRSERHPDAATGLGDHRFDARLPDPSALALADERRALDGWAARLGVLDRGALSAEHQVDAAMMADSIARRVFEIDELREHTWNPLLANPGKAIYQLLARDFAPLPDRLGSVAGRLAEVPGVLAEARRQLGRMPRVHLETAIGQFGGTIALISNEIDAALEAAPQRAAGLAQGRQSALEALTGHRTWLPARLAETDGHGGFADPRIGPELFARKLSL